MTAMLVDVQLNRLDLVMAKNVDVCKRKLKAAICAAFAAHCSELSVDHRLVIMLAAALEEANDMTNDLGHDLARLAAADKTGELRAVIFRASEILEESLLACTRLHITFPPGTTLASIAQQALPPDWDEKNRRRGELIQKLSARTITDQETEEFERLQREMRAALDRTFPLPDFSAEGIERLPSRRRAVGGKMKGRLR